MTYKLGNFIPFLYSRLWNERDMGNNLILSSLVLPRNVPKIIEKGIEKLAILEDVGDYAEEYKNYDIDVIHLPLSRKELTYDKINDLLNEMGDGPRQVCCRRGVVRSGMVGALHQIRHGATVIEAEKNYRNVLTAGANKSAINEIREYANLLILSKMHQFAGYQSLPKLSLSHQSM